MVAILVILGLTGAGGALWTRTYGFGEARAGTAGRDTTYPYHSEAFTAFVAERVRWPVEHRRAVR